MAPKADFVWMDGELRPWEQATVHVMTHTLHYGLGVFEGIRAYEGANGLSVFRLGDHIQRLFDSAKIAGIDLSQYTPEQICQACVETIRSNKLGNCYIRPLVFYSDGEVGLGAINPTRVAIAAFPWGAYLGKEGLEKGIRATISSFTRQHMGSNVLQAKICGQYTTSIMAKRLALQDGYAEAIFLDNQGWVAEGTGENLFTVKDGVIKTPPERSAILPGITRDSVLVLAQDMAAENKWVIREEAFARDELLLADEVFLTGTAAEVTPIREIDGKEIGNSARGPVTAELQRMFFDAVTGKLDQYSHWLTAVD